MTWISDAERVVVIGGGMAGARFALQAGATANTRRPLAVTVIGEEPHPGYNRVLLAEVLAGRLAPEVIALPEDDRSGTCRLRGVRAVRIDRAERRVLCDDGRAVPYDRLVLATGSNPVLPPLRGLFGRNGTEEGLPEGVRAFRTMDDLLALERELRPARTETGDHTPRAVVIGGGLLGVSAARALTRRGAQVVLAHQGEHLMERHLDAEASALLHRHLTGLGVEVHTECRVRGLHTGLRAVRAAPIAPAGPNAPAAPAVRAVEFADGFALEAELVVLACGVRPRTGLARAAGLAVGRGVLVDDSLRTSDPRVFAIGDCAEHDGVVHGLADAAQEQADALARGFTDGPQALRYTGTRALTRLTLAATARQSPGPDPALDPALALDLDLAAFGETDPLPGDDVVRLADATRGVYRKVVVRGDRLAGGILLGDLGTVGALARTWESDEPLSAAPLLHLLTPDGGTR